MVDRTIVIKAFEGDEVANQQLYEATFKKVFTIASRILNNYEDAMDLCQEAYLNALIHIDSLQDKSKFDVWLYQITANRCYNFVKREKRRHSIFTAAEYTDYLDSHHVDTADYSRAFNPEEYAVNLDKKIVISHLIDELPINQKTCVLMHYYAELSISEIAATLRIPEGTVKSNIYYAKKKLKKAILAHHKDYAYKGTTGNSIDFIIKASVTEPPFPLPPVRYILMLREKVLNTQAKKEL